MTIFNMVELCKVEVPKASETMIVALLNEKIKLFAHESEIYKNTGDITIVADTVEYTLATEFSDIDGEMVVSVNFLDSNREQVADIYQLKFDISKGKIRFYSYINTSITSIPSQIIHIEIQYVAVPPNKTVDDALTEIDSQFHDGIRSGVASVLYSLYPTIDKILPDGSVLKLKDMTMMKYHENNYNTKLHNAKRFAYAGSPIPKEIYSKGF